ncbi:E3 ubiquitin-protein ligase NEURL3 [Anomaloglossus baeobatrachus]|uniref:E3 ubiquitin-protein ligase NEURL3 n=1 Tax=Anomaloglossus baeobatrachus TaxID=238106 RepID=UPI003F502D35
MGLTCSSEAPGLSFHPHSKGYNINLNSCLHIAERNHSFHDGIVFSNRPVRPREEVWIRILEVEQRWFGALRLGFTSVNPNNLDSTSLPPFACPNLTNMPDFWAIGIPEELCKQGEEICFWINKKGQALYKKRGRFKPKVLFSGIPRKRALWVMLDVYGQTKALQMMDGKPKHRLFPCCCPDNIESSNLSLGHPETIETKGKDLPLLHSKQCMEKSSKLDLGTEVMNLQVFREEEPNCVICVDRMADTLLLPCKHCSFCKQCVLKIRAQSNICPLCRQSIRISQDVRQRHLFTNDGR